MSETKYSKGTFGYDAEFISSRFDSIILSEGESKILLSAKLQSRVVTSSAAGMNGKSHGWINYDLINSGKIVEHMNPYGGEERFWIGPEGGQFSVFFRKGVQFDLEHWFTPKEIDTDEYKLISSDEKKASFSKDMHIINYAGSKIDISLRREVRIIPIKKISVNLSLELPSDVQSVAFESDNCISNAGANEWTKETGAPSIWMIGMLNCSPCVTVAVPYKTGDDKKLGKIVTDDYFGIPPKDRLKVDEGIIFFKGDANFRSKIGIAPKRVIPTLGSYDSESNVLSIMKFSFRDGIEDYVNSLWKLQDEPFRGDVINSYNDGPNETGSQLGKFFELENSSPAAFLKPGESYTHKSSMYHFTGNEKSLSKISKAVLGVDIDKIKFAL